MWFRLAALAALTLVPCVPPAWAQAPAVPPSVLTLDEAFARTARAHPDLRLAGVRHELLEAERDAAVQAPPRVLGLEVENVAGTGEARGVDGAEATLTLAGVLERGGKSGARRALAQGRIDALAAQHEARRLDLLADVARRYLAAAAAEADARIARRDIAQRRDAVAAARVRMQAGASPEPVVLAAEAELARAELLLERAGLQAAAAYRHLAALWGEREPGFTLAPADLLELPRIAPLEALAALLQDSPALLQLADERRIGEARLRLAQSAAVPDLDWQVGVRRLADGDGAALVGSVSLPLGAGARAAPGIRAATAELAALDLEREGRDAALYSTLAEAHGRYAVARNEARRTGDEILPRLERATSAAGRAYRAGALSHLEWSRLQSEATAALRQQLAAAVEARLALIELQRLTASPLLAGAAPLPNGDRP